MKKDSKITYDSVLATVISDGLSSTELSEIRKAVVKQETDNYHKERKLIYEIEMSDDFAHCFKHRKDAIEYLTTDIKDNPDDYFKDETVRLKTRWLDLETYNSYNDSWLEV